MIISFIGAPGSGKSTQIKKLINFLSERTDTIVLRVPKLISLDKEISSFLSTDEIHLINNFREMANKSKDKGVLAPILFDDIIFSLISRIVDKKFIILDGMPRGYEQAKLFLQKNKTLDKTIFIHLNFFQDAYEFSVSRQFYRESLKYGVEKAGSKLNKFINKYNVYKYDTLKGISYLLDNGAKIHTYNAIESEDNIHKDICSKVNLEFVK